MYDYLSIQNNIADFYAWRRYLYFFRQSGRRFISIERFRSLLVFISIGLLYKTLLRAAADNAVELENATIMQKIMFFDNKNSVYNVYYIDSAS